LEDIHKLLNKVSYGLTQDVEWDGEPDFDEMIEDDFNRRERNYNRY
jgi:hypothetical protein